MLWLGLLVGWIASGLVVAWAVGRWFRWLREQDENEDTTNGNHHVDE